MGKWKSPESYQRARVWVNSEYGRLTRGKTISNTKKTKLLKKLWRQAEKKY